MTYNLFISHSWTYSTQYNNLVRLLDASPYFSYKNYSVPKDNPIHNAPYQYQLKEAIRRQMQPASCVIIMAGVYSTYSKRNGETHNCSRTVGFSSYFCGCKKCGT